VSASAGMGVVTLHPGTLVSGTVLTPSLGAAANVDIKWVDVAADHRRFLSKTLTDVNGAWSIRVPQGTWRLDFRPAATTTFGAGERLPLAVGAAAISGLTDTLRTGSVVTGTVRTKSGNVKLKNVDVSFFDECSGKSIATAHDNTDVNGNFSVVVPPGKYTFTADPAVCSGVGAY